MAPRLRHGPRRRQERRLGLHQRLAIRGNGRRSDARLLSHSPGALGRVHDHPHPRSGCDTDPEVDDLTSITFRFTGADCASSDNNQDDGKWDCSGDAGASPAIITIIEDPSRITADLARCSSMTCLRSLAISGRTRELSIGGQQLEFHTSCSQPLEVGDSFGSIEIVAINGASPGNEVTYTYEVTNTGSVTVTDVSVDDDVLGRSARFPRSLRAPRWCSKPRPSSPTRSPTL